MVTYPITQAPSILFLTTTVPEITGYIVQDG